MAEIDSPQIRGASLGGGGDGGGGIVGGGGDGGGSSGTASPPLPSPLHFKSVVHVAAPSTEPTTFPSLLVAK